ncbi:MAG: hypothetical protein K0Q51_640 [Rickettsiaceae bacterium]|jgi:hypothetical protein|nr:hypothetical protein [Rickettsiaceae bacterium]
MPENKGYFTAIKAYLYPNTQGDIPAIYCEDFVKTFKASPKKAFNMFFDDHKYSKCYTAHKISLEAFVNNNHFSYTREEKNAIHYMDQAASYIKCYGDSKVVDIILGTSKYSEEDNS